MQDMGIPVEIGAASVEEQLIIDPNPSSAGFEERVVVRALAKTAETLSSAVAAGHGSVSSTRSGVSSAARGVGCEGGGDKVPVIVLDSEDDACSVVEVANVVNVTRGYPCEGAARGYPGEGAAARTFGAVHGALAATSAASGNLGTHSQTADDLRAAYTAGFGSTASTPIQCGRAAVRGLSVVPTPLALLLPPTSPPSLGFLPLVQTFLVVEKREIRGSGMQRAAFLGRLRAEPGLVGRVEDRMLPVGDALVVARVTAAGQAAFPGAPVAGTELVLDHLLERKTVADLASSFRDGRTMEQTYFMAAAGLEGLCMVVEGNVSAHVNGKSIMTADMECFLMQLNVEGGFFIKYTEDVGETAAYYSSLVRYSGELLQTPAGFATYLQGGVIPIGGTTSVGGDAEVGEAGAAGGIGVGAEGCDAPCGGRTYDAWTALIRDMRKETTLQQLWALQLYVLPGVGTARVDVIMGAGYVTPACLSAAYKAAASVEEGRMLLARIDPPARCSRISKKLSAFLYDLFCAEASESSPV